MSIFWWEKKTIKDLKINLSREQIKKRSRLLVIDNDKPDDLKIIDSMRNSDYAVDYLPDIIGKEIHKLDSGIYDLIILDFGGIGEEFGPNEGLDVLKYIKRVSPATVVIAYTSKALGAEHSEFFKLSDGTLKKDAGIKESMEKIDEALNKAFSVDFMWNAIILSLNIMPGSIDDLNLQNMLVKTIEGNVINKIGEKLNGIVSKQKLGQCTIGLIGKLIQVYVEYKISGITSAAQAIKGK